jgi:predicted phosphodiesterase
MSKKSLKKDKKIVVIGDCHVTSDQNLRRFDWLNKYLLENTPDVLIIIGDFLTLNSLSAWDRDKRLLMEGRRLEREFDFGNAALDRLEKNLSIHVRTGYSNYPRLIFIEGNHEERLGRYIESHPELEGKSFSVRHRLALDDRGWEWIPYRSYVEINGIFFTHIPFGKSREISGKDICSKAELVTIGSTVFGHTHELHTSCVHKHGMKHLQQILNVGCYFEQDEEYVEGKMTNYWKGIVELTNYDYGRFDIKTISMGHLQRGYS